jgi:hypothetical protein
MARVTCEVVEAELENEDGYPVDGIEVTCSRCGHRVECYGTSDRSERRALVMMREECPEELGNFYVAAGCRGDSNAGRGLT